MPTAQKEVIKEGSTMPYRPIAENIKYIPSKPNQEQEVCYSLIQESEMRKEQAYFYLGSYKSALRQDKSRQIDVLR